MIAEDATAAELREALDVLERVRAGASAGWSTLGPPSELLERAPAEAAEALGLDRVLLSRIEDGSLVAESLHARRRGGAALAALGAPVVLDYPLVEGEVLRRRRPQLVACRTTTRRTAGSVRRGAALARATSPRRSCSTAA